MGRLITYYRAAWRARAELELLDDRMLRDIGLDPYDVPRIATLILHDAELWSGTSNRERRDVWVSPCLNRANKYPIKTSFLIAAVALTLTREHVLAGEGELFPLRGAGLIVIINATMAAIGIGLSRLK